MDYIVYIVNFIHLIKNCKLKLFFLYLWKWMKIKSMEGGLNMRVKIKHLMILSILFIFIGLILLFGSVNFGSLLTESWLSQQYDQIDTTQYETIAQGYINNFLVAGSILFACGIATITILLYKTLKIK